MLNINRIIMAGNLAKDPETKEFGNNKTKTILTLAVNKTYKNQNGDLKKDTSYFRVITWNVIAKNCGKYLRKGSSILVEGSLENLSYEDNSGARKYITQINCDNVSFLSQKKSQRQSDNSELLL